MSARGGGAGSGVTAPFWFAFAGSAVLLVLIWRSLIQVGHEEEPTIT